MQRRSSLLCTFLKGWRSLKKEVITVVGAGGKTTLLFRLAKKYRKEEKKVLLTTTTKMYKEKETLMFESLEKVREKLNREGFCMVGRPCQWEPQKISALSVKEQEEVLNEADVILVEGDGAKHFPCKYPRQGEPILFPGTTKIVLIMGLSSLGKRIREGMFRYSEFLKSHRYRPEDRITHSVLEEVIQDGYLSQFQGKGMEIELLFSKKKEGRLEFIDYEAEMEGRRSKPNHL